MKRRHQATDNINQNTLAVYPYSICKWENRFFILLRLRTAGLYDVLYTVRTYKVATETTKQEVVEGGGEEEDNDEDAFQIILILACFMTCIHVKYRGPRVYIININNIIINTPGTHIDIIINNITNNHRVADRSRKPEKPKQSGNI